MVNEVLQNIIKKKGREYDVAVMYSGGKDSAYLLYLLKEIYHLRVLAVMVDNGYEHDYTWKPMQDFTEKMGIDLKVLCPKKEMFTKLFQMLITEHEEFKREGVNHICFICNNLLWCCVAQYAMEHEIPYVASGLSLAQLNSGRSKPLLPDGLANAIAERSTRMIYKNAVDNMKKTKIYCNNKDFQEYINGFGDAIKCVMTIYPYIYHSVSVMEQKQSLEKLGWQPPNRNSLEKYISSGCRMMRGVVYELEKIEMITLNEREQAKVMVGNNLIDKEQLKFAEQDVSGQTVNLGTEEIKELQVEKYLEKLCIERGKQYIK